MQVELCTKQTGSTKGYLTSNTMYWRRELKQNDQISKRLTSQRLLFCSIIAEFLLQPFVRNSWEFLSVSLNKPHNENNLLSFPTSSILNTDFKTLSRSLFTNLLSNKMLEETLSFLKRKFQFKFPILTTSTNKKKNKTFPSVAKKSNSIFLISFNGVRIMWEVKKVFLFLFH